MQPSGPTQGLRLGEYAFLTGSQVMLMAPVWGPQLSLATVFEIRFATSSRFCL